MIVIIRLFLGMEAEYSDHNHSAAETLTLASNEIFLFHAIIISAKIQRCRGVGDSLT